MRVDRTRLEKLTVSLATTLLGMMVFILTLVVANYVFVWDLFPQFVEKAGLVILICSFITIIASVIINIMINISRIADKFNEKS